MIATPHPRLYVIDRQVGVFEDVSTVCASPLISGEYFSTMH
jgi:hypothetical protein